MINLVLEQDSRDLIADIGGRLYLVSRREVEVVTKGSSLNGEHQVSCTDAYHQYLNYFLILYILTTLLHIHIPSDFSPHFDRKSAEPIFSRLLSTVASSASMR